MKQPEGFLADGQDLVCRFRKSIRGFKHVVQMLESSTRCTAKADGLYSDPCIYTSTTESDGLFIVDMYVDNILLAGKSQQKIARIKADLGKQFQLKDMGELHYFLGVSVRQHSEEIWIGQPAHTYPSYY